MRNFVKIKELLLDAPDCDCNMAYMDGFRLGEDWAGCGITTVAELVAVGQMFKSILEVQAESDGNEADEYVVKEGYIPVMSHLTSLKYIGGLFSRHFFCGHYMYTGGSVYGPEALKDFEQGFLDAVRQFCKYVRDELKKRMESYHNARQADV